MRPHLADIEQQPLAEVVNVLPAVPREGLGADLQAGHAVVARHCAQGLPLTQLHQGTWSKSQREGSSGRAAANVSKTCQELGADDDQGYACM